MKTTIEAMKLALLAAEAFTDPEGRMPDTTGEFNDLKAVIPVLTEAIAREEAQSVEPVFYWNGFRKTDVREGSSPSFSEEENTWHDIPLFTHPAPAKQTMSAERTALISEIQSLANLPKQLLPIVKRAVDMLAADAQDIDWQDMYHKQKREKEAMATKYEKDIGPLAKAGPVCQTQQVAVPQVDAMRITEGRAVLAAQKDKQ